MKKLLSVLTMAVLSLSMLAGCGGGAAQSGDSASAEDVQIGIIQYTAHPALDAAREGFISKLSEHGYKDGENCTIDVQNAQADQSNLKTISQKFVTDGKDLVLAIATPAAQSMAAETKDIPILVTAVTDPAQSGLCESNEVPNTNVSGTSDLTPVKEQIALLKQILPEAKKIGIMYCSGEQNSVIQAEMAKEAAKENGLETEELTVSNTNDVAEVTTSALGKFDALYVPTDNILASSMPLVSSITNPAGLPLFVGEQGMVEGGGLASVAVNYTNLGELTGQMAVDIFNGADIKNMAIQYTENPELIINETAAAELGVTIPDDVKTKATVVNTNTESN
ncbi:MAG: ABC transporter substrate binding protein [Lachnospirales bacterium]